MSEQTTAAPGRVGAPTGGGQPSSGGLGFLTRKVGGFPVWVYVAVLAGLLAWRYIASKNAAASTSASADTSQAPSSTDASQVPQFVNQTYTTVTPPAAPGSATGKTPRPPTHKPVPKVAQFPKPTNLKATHPSKNGVTLTWNTVAASGGVYPESYTVEVFNAKGKEVSTTTVDTPDATKGQGTTTLVGLPPNSQLRANIWANGGQQAPQHSTVAFKTAA